MFSTTVTTKYEWNMYGILAKWIDLQCLTSECRVYYLLSSYAFSMKYTNVKQSEAKQSKARQSNAKRGKARQSKAKPSRTVMKEKKPNLCNICFHFITLRPCFFYPALSPHAFYGIHISSRICSYKFQHFIWIPFLVLWHKWKKASHE